MAAVEYPSPRLRVFRNNHAGKRGCRKSLIIVTKRLHSRAPRAGGLRPLGNNIFKDKDFERNRENGLGRGKRRPSAFSGDIEASCQDPARGRRDIDPIFLLAGRSPTGDSQRGDGAAFPRERPPRPTPIRPSWPSLLRRRCSALLHSARTASNIARGPG